MPLQMVLGERTWQLYPPGGKLGRNQGLSITIPNQTVSGEHAEFTWDDAAKQWWIRPLRANNPVYLNGQELPQARQPLPSDGELIFGNVTVRFSYEAVGTRQKDSTPPTLGPIPIKPGFQRSLTGEVLRGASGAPSSQPASQIFDAGTAPPTAFSAAPPAFLRSTKESPPGKQKESPRTASSELTAEAEQKLARSQRAHERARQLAKQAGGVFVLLASLCIVGWMLGVRFAGS